MKILVKAAHLFQATQTPEMARLKSMMAQSVPASLR